MPKMFAIFRSYPDKDLAKIGEEHLQNDLSAQDRDHMRSAASKVSKHTAVGTILGLGLGLALASRIHSNRIALYNAIKAVSKPTELIFANGRREAIPDLEPYIRPTRWSDAATYTAFGLGGTFLGGELGFLSGSASAGRYIAGYPESQRNIESAFRKFQVDVLKREIDALEGKKRGEYSWESMKEKAAGMASSLR
ncbi:hypothetical protein B0T16DRAFT_497871 [Cercophora newfieldiana]|uniref:Uncharacterized protein n=1 Tax=Cercophora newfieldiana TaxID=92897 RepID=A0AA40CIB9_9PEZI|nr:hypothetical protein B0T16DRAFT_497871 [Cercophora newfieldiana]